MGNVHNVLAENISVMNPVLHSLTFNTQSTKCVYKNAKVFVTPTLDQHAGANHQNLFDNVTLHMPAVRTDDGPMARIVGLHGNRVFKLDYRPAPYVELLNETPKSIPSLYEYQRHLRLVND